MAGKTLQQVIEEQRAVVAQCQRGVARAQSVLDRAMLELATLERAAASIGGGAKKPRTASKAVSPPQIVLPLTRPGRGGRVKGELSKKWRAILGAMAGNGRVYTVDGIKAVTEALDIKMKIEQIRYQMRGYANEGLVEKSDDGYRVTRLATERFGFSKG